MKKLLIKNRIILVILSVFLFVTIFPNRTYAGWEHAWDGTKVHSAVQELFGNNFRFVGSTVRCNKKIKGSNGRPDLVLDYRANSTTEIYELKPETYRIGYKRKMADSQLNGYISDYKAGYGRNAIKGTSWNNISGRPIPIPRSNKVAIIDANFLIEPGMIWYYKVEAHNPKTIYSTSPSPVKTKSGDNWTMYAKDKKTNSVLVSRVVNGLLVLGVGTIVAGVLVLGLPVSATAAVVASIMAFVSYAIRLVPGVNEILDAQSEENIPVFNQ